MNKWLLDVKEVAKNDAEYIFEIIRDNADREEVDFEWFYQEVLNNLRTFVNKHLGGE